MLWVAAAGPFANLVMAVIWAFALKMALIAPANAFTLPLSLMAEAGITVNLVLMVLNLLPILPLDGGRIAVSLLPNRLAYSYSRLEPYGFPILLLLLFTNTLGVILNPAVVLSMQLIESIFQIQL
jgi:Zn-dependent protease